jgi:hypothetical protein
MKDSVPGPAERQVRAAPIRTMEFNILGQVSVLLALPVDLLMAIEWVMGRVLEIPVVVFMFLAAFAALACGVRGYNAATRGLATNRLTSIVGIALSLFVILGFRVVPL